MSASCDVIVFFLVHGQFAAIQKLDSENAWSMKLTLSLIATFYLTDPENRTKKSLKQLLYYCFE